MSFLKLGGNAKKLDRLTCAAYIYVNENSLLIYGPKLFMRDDENYRRYIIIASRWLFYSVSDTAWPLNCFII